MLRNNYIIEDGFRPDLVENAFFAGTFEIPVIEKPTELVIPKGMVPFSSRKRDSNHEFFVCFYEHDCKFFDVINATDNYIEELKQYPGVISPDCSLYIDAPLCLQITNIYLNRAVGCKLQSEGLYVIPNVRWGDERTYTKMLFKEKVAFAGLPKHSIVSVGTYGCIKSKEAKYHFREGLISMLDEIEPEVVLVYGSMPESVFQGLDSRTKFINYPDWIRLKKGGMNNGHY